MERYYPLTPPVPPRGIVEYFEGALHSGGQYLLLGCSEEGGKLHVVDDAGTFEDAKTKAELFLEDHPCGGVLIERHMCAVYRTPQFTNSKES